ncbi:citrate synthase-like protein [Entophlyctis helioformis]|nr:citrate synthase-like protein [Entophlyctis helioformis]
MAAVAPPSDSLTVTDSLTGATVTVPILSNDVCWIPATAFAQIKIAQTTPPPVSPADTVPIRLYDQGFKNTAVCKSAISSVDGENGKLYYRGYDVEDLVEHCDFLEVAYLLLHGELPNKVEGKTWAYNIMTHNYLHTGLERQMSTFRHDAHPMGMVISTIAALSTFHPDANPALKGENLYVKPRIAPGKTPTPEEADRIRKVDETRNATIYRMVGRMTTIAANAYRHRLGRPFNRPLAGSMDYCENLLYMMDKLNEIDYRPDPRLVKILNKVFILLAESGSNCSTVMMRHLASSGVDPYTALSGAAGALFGERKSSAVVDMLKRIGSVDRIDEFLSLVKQSGTTARDSIATFSPRKNRLRLMGFGHRIWKTHDPRVRLCKTLTLELFEIMGKGELGEIALQLEARALSDPYFINRKLYPNIDYWTGVFFHTLQFPSDMFPVWMLLPRVAGMIAHLVESIDDPEYKIYRPRQIYIGENHRPYEPLDFGRRPSMHPDAAAATLGLEYQRSDPQAARRRGANIGEAEVWDEIAHIQKALEDMGRTLDAAERDKSGKGRPGSPASNAAMPIPTVDGPTSPGSTFSRKIEARAESIRGLMRTLVGGPRSFGGSGGNMSQQSNMETTVEQLKKDLHDLQERQAQLLANLAMHPLPRSPSSTNVQDSGSAQAPARSASSARLAAPNSSVPNLLSGSGSPRVIARQPTQKESHSQ